MEKTTIVSLDGWNKYFIISLTRYNRVNGNHKLSKLIDAISQSAFYQMRPSWRRQICFLCADSAVRGISWSGAACDQWSSAGSWRYHVPLMLHPYRVSTLSMQHVPWTLNTVSPVNSGYESIGWALLIVWARH